MLRLSLDLITFPLYPRIILETRLRVLTFKVMMWPTKLTSPTCIFFSVKDLTESGDKMKFWSSLEFYFNLCLKDKWGGGGGGVNFSVLKRGFRRDVWLFLFFLLTPWNGKGISFSGRDTNFYLFTQINWHWQKKISLTKEKYNLLPRYYYRRVPSGGRSGGGGRGGGGGD